MLEELVVENVAIIDRAAITLGPGFTALTGETGAGKSLLIDAIDLALGGRADSDLVRAGASRATVNLVADLSANPAALAKCAELGVEAEDGRLVVQRDVSAEGRSSVRLNGKPAAVGALRELGYLLVDLHGQHDHQALLVPERQIEFLDAWIGEECHRYRADVAERYAEAEALRRRLNGLRSSRREREQRRDMLRFQVEEIETVGPDPGEMEGLEARLSRLQHAERLAAAAHAALATLSDDEGSALERMGTALRELESVVALDPSLAETIGPLREGYVALQEGARGVSQYLGGIEPNPEALQAAADRIEALRTLRRKYGDDEAAVLRYLDEAHAELTALEEGGQSEDEVTAALEAAEAALNEAAARLTEVRAAKATEFESRVREQLRDLAMERADLAVQRTAKPIDIDGADRIEFLFTANAGEPLRPLSKVASGGELSRVMLAIKVASAGRAGVPTLIFDEVDTGLSGRAAAVTARKLEELATHTQVVVISHLPQIAGRAATHFRIEKQEAGGRVTTIVRQLADGERVEELARMLAGEKVGDSALANARELLRG